MLNSENLKNKLLKINNKGYKAYKEIEGEYKFSNFYLYIDQAQSDPFAPPSKIRIKVNQEVSSLPYHLFSNPIRKIALEDYLHRKLYNSSLKLSTKSGSGKSGIILVDKCCQEVLPRSVIKVEEKFVEARIYVGLPAKGRTILAAKAIEIFFELIPRLVNNTLIFKNLDSKKIQHHIECIEDQEWLRNNLDKLGLVAFIANGAILPRESGVSEKPLTQGALPFLAPPSLEIEVELPNQGKIKGLGIKKGITLITGGGFHGKSTLLKALERGIYNHIPGDGREGVVTLESAVKIRAEDGRFIASTDISPFISNLPFNLDTQKFSTPNASGSTSQAANIIEALESKSKLLLLDEDTCATNFMIRDKRMQTLIHKEDEPITPFIDRVKELYTSFGVSTILVLGGCGDYLEVADTVIMMKNYKPLDVTLPAKKIIKEIPLTREKETIKDFTQLKLRKINKFSFPLIKKIKVKDKYHILVDRELLDLSFLEQLACQEQTQVIALILKRLSSSVKKEKTLLQAVEEIFKDLEKKGLDSLSPYFPRHPGSLALPRLQEVMGAINRYRKLKIF